MLIKGMSVTCAIFINIFFQMFLLFLFITSNLIQFTASQDLDNDGNDIDNDQDLTINAFGNVITPIKGKKFMQDTLLFTSWSLSMSLPSLSLFCGSVNSIREEIIIRRSKYI